MKKRGVTGQDELDSNSLLEGEAETKLIKKLKDENAALLLALEAKGNFSIDAFRNFLHRGADINCCDKVNFFSLFSLLLWDDRMGGVLCIMPLLEDGPKFWFICLTQELI